jgi:hypothetical protein
VEWILKGRLEECGLGCFGSWNGQVTGCCEDGNEHNSWTLLTSAGCMSLSRNTVPRRLSYL